MQPLLAGAVALAVAAVPRAASGHTGMWRVHEILAEPGNPDHLVLRSDVQGLIRTTDGGETWRWICAEAYGSSSVSRERRSMVLLPGGTLMVANQFDGLQIGRDDLCGFTEHPTFTDEVVQDVVRGAPDGSALYVLTSTGSPEGLTARIWRSTDRGSSWSPVGTEFPGDFSGTSLAVAPSDPERLYVSGKSIDDTTNARVLRSTDAGESWQGFTVEVGDSESFAVRLAGIDPRDPDTVYLWKDRSAAAAGHQQPDAIWRSVDGGESWSPIFEGTADLPGFALIRGGDKLLVAGPDDGIWAADTAALSAGPSAFEQVFERSIWDLALRDGALLAGHNDFGADAPRFSLGRSKDEGASFEPVFEICDAELSGCGAATRTGSNCADLVEFFEANFLDSARCDPEALSGAGAGAGGAATAPTDASTAPTDTSAAGSAGTTGSAAGDDGGSPFDAGPIAPSGVRQVPAFTESNGCGCRVTSDGSRFGGWVLAGAVACVAMGARRRGRRRSR